MSNRYFIDDPIINSGEVFYPIVVWSMEEGWSDREFKRVHEYCKSRTEAERMCRILNNERTGK